MSLDQIKIDTLVDWLSGHILAHSTLIPLDREDAVRLLDYLSYLEGTVSALEDEVADLEGALQDAERGL